MPKFLVLEKLRQRDVCDFQAREDNKTKQVICKLLPGAPLAVPFLYKSVHTFTSTPIVNTGQTAKVLHHPRTGLLQMSTFLNEEVYCLILPVSPNPQQSLTSFKAHLQHKLNKPSLSSHLFLDMS